ncbi:MAG: hypothetical protein ACTTGZ_07190 [Treponema sp.]
MLSFEMDDIYAQASFSLETARRRNLACVQTMLISKLDIEPI